MSPMFIWCPMCIAAKLLGSKCPTILVSISLVFVFGSLCSFFHFIRRFWNQILICLSERTKEWAISILLRRVRYLQEKSIIVLLLKPKGIGMRSWNRLTERFLVDIFYYSSSTPSLRDNIHYSYYNFQTGSLFVFCLLLYNCTTCHGAPSNRVSRSWWTAWCLFGRTASRAIIFLKMLYLGNSLGIILTGKNMLPRNKFLPLNGKDNSNLPCEFLSTISFLTPYSTNSKLLKQAGIAMNLSSKGWEKRFRTSGLIFFRATRKISNKCSPCVSYFTTGL